MGNLIRAEDRRGNVRTFTYQFDFNGSGIYQQTHEYWWDGSSVVNDISSNYDSLGRLVSEGDNGSQYVYDYTSLSQLRYVRSDVSATLEDGTAIGLWYTYDELGRLATTSAALQGSDPVGETIVAADFRNEYTYTNDGHLVSISQAGVSGVGNNTVTTKAVGFSWDQFGRLSEVDRSMVWSGNLLPYLRTTFDYDEAGALSGLTQIHVNVTTTPTYSEILTTLHTYSWDYDDAGRLETATTPDGTTDYTYDDTDQLTGVDSSYQADETYSYDENGNRTNSGYVTGDNNRVLSDGIYNYTYDAEGNRTSRTKISDGSYVSYTWDYRQRLTEVTFKTSVSGTITKQIAYTYDTQNRLLVKQLDSTGNGTFEEIERYAYDGANVVLQLDDTDTVEHRYLQGQGIDQLFADENAVNDVLWALTDNQGTVRDWVEFNTPSVAPTVVEHLQYDAFGQITDDSNPSLDTRYAYTGREWDADAELYYYRARWYDPAVGSFISEDPLSFAAGDANLQRYVGNSPTNAIDPFGMAEYKDLGPLLAPEGDFLTGNGYYPGTPGMVWDVDGIPWLLDPADVARLADAEGDMYSMAASINDLFFWGESYDDVRQDIIAKIRTNRLKNKLYQTDYAAKNQVDPLDHIGPGREHYKEYIARQKEKVQYTTDVASAAVPLAKGALKLVRTPPKLPFGMRIKPCPVPSKSPTGITPNAISPKGARGPATAWKGFDEALAGGPVRDLTTRRIRVTDRGIAAVERHVGRFGPDRANNAMIERLRQISRGELQPTPQDLNFYSHELRESIRYRRLGWPSGVPADGDAALDLWRQTHSATLDDYDLPLRRDDLLYHPDALPLIGQ